MHTGVLIITETQKGSYWNGNSVSDICVTYLGNNATQADAFICLLVYCLILESVLSDREGVHIFNCDFSSVCGGKKKMWVRIKTVVGTLDRIEMVTDYKLLLRARDGKLWKQMWNMQAVEEGFSSIHFSGSVLSYSLQPHGLHHARPPCPKPPHGACLKSCSSSWWCHSTISSSVLPFSSHLQSFPTSGSFSMSQFFALGGQSIGVSASASSEYSGQISCRIDWFDLLAVQGNLKSLIQHHSSNTSILWCSAFFTFQLSHPYTTTGKTTAFQTLVAKVMPLLFNMLSRFVIAFLPRSKHFLISRLQAPSAVILEPQLFPLFPHLFAMKWWDWMPWSKFSECWVLSKHFHSSPSLSSKVSL